MWCGLASHSPILPSHCNEHERTRLHAQHEAFAVSLLQECVARQQEPCAAPELCDTHTAGVLSGLHHPTRGYGTYGEDMKPLYSVKEVRAGEQPLLDAQWEPDQLMRQAARGVAKVALDILKQQSPLDSDNAQEVLVLAGAGGNGGDSLFAGSHVAQSGYPCRAILVDSHGKVHQPALKAFTEAGGKVLSDWQEQLSRGELSTSYTLIIDGILGIGGHGGLREPAATLVKYVHGYVLAVDIPSGVSADTGVAHDPHVTATRTVTFGGLRYAHALSPECGHVELCDIGLTGTDSSPAAPPPQERRTLSQTLPPSTTFYHQALHTAGWESLEPKDTDNKYSGGVVGICAGSERFPGAGILAATAAVRATPAMVRYVGNLRDMVVTSVPEVVVSAQVAETGRVQCWVVGPGRGTDSVALSEFLELLNRPEPLVIDADALTLLAQSHDAQKALQARNSFTLLTPHEGEFQRLQALSEDRLSSVRNLAHRYGCSVLLKGRRTIVSDGSRVDVVNAESSWAATPGSGDVLAGILGAYIARAAAQNISLYDAAVRAVILHARASYESAITPAGEAPTSASRIAEAIPLATARLCSY